MAKIEKHVELTFTLTLTEKEARILKGITQNPFPNAEQEDKELFESIFNGLKEALTCESRPYSYYREESHLYPEIDN